MEFSGHFVVGFGLAAGETAFSKPETRATHCLGRIGIVHHVVRDVETNLRPKYRGLRNWNRVLGHIIR